MRPSTYALLIALFTATCIPFGLARAAQDNDRFDALKRFSQVLDIVERYYVKDVPRKDLVDGALKGMLQSLDPHSSMLSKEEYTIMQEATTGEFVGIGIEITTENNQLRVVTPIEDTPAYKAGLKPGDIIIAIDGMNAFDMTLQEAVSKIRGKKGSEIKLTILHKDAKAPEIISMLRDSIPLISVKSQDLGDGYHWIRLTRFSEKTTDELHETLKDIAKKAPIQGIVLDLRNNPGGLLDQAIDVSDTFLQEGTIVSMRTRDEENVRKFTATQQKSDISAPVVVLINAGSASASEIVAGALGDQKRALIVGERSFGKGSVQNIIPLSDGSGLKITVARYYTPSGRSIQAEGIDPGFEIAFEAPRKQTTSILPTVREKDLERHLSNTPESKDKKRDKKNIDAQTILERDNQLRMALQLIKALPGIQELTN